VFFALTFEPTHCHSLISYVLPGLKRKDQETENTKLEYNFETIFKAVKGIVLEFTRKDLQIDAYNNTNAVYTKTQDAAWFEESYFYVTEILPDTGTRSHIRILTNILYSTS
jgi:hypothetical protein